MDIDEFFTHLWQDYTALTPQAERIYQAFTRKGETVVNDHVAFRTYDRAPIQLKSLEPHLLELGYKRYAPYHFKDKKISAWGYVPPSADKPRIFMSELLTGQLSESSQKIINDLCRQVDPARVKDIDIFWTGRPWNVPSWEDYQALLAESEYAAWLSVIGLRTNHFTISVNHLRHHRTLEEVLNTIEEENIAINTHGGKIKGQPEQLLVQASTMADKTIVSFAGGDGHEIPTCYYEFALRYKDAAGKLFQGFVPASADRIFESTDNRSSNM